MTQRAALLENDGGSSNGAAVGRSPIKLWGVVAVVAADRGL
jgi:hypothetical protein